MTVAMTIGTHNLSAVPVILVVLIIGVAIYVIKRRRTRPPNGRDR
jgi:cytochrome c-type biogenesis protein CcmH/NrfF